MANVPDVPEQSDNRDTRCGCGSYQFYSSETRGLVCFVDIDNSNRLICARHPDVTYGLVRCANCGERPKYQFKLIID